MKSAFLACLGCLVLALAAGCQQLDVTPETGPDRVVTGVVNLKPDILFPADTQVLIRIVDTSGPQRTTGANEIVVPQGTRMPDERVVAEQTIRSPSGKPVPFQIEFKASETLMRRGLLIDVRVSYHNRVQFRTLNAHMLSLSNLRLAQEVWVQASY